MQAWCIEVSVRSPWKDPATDSIAARLEQAGLELSGSILPLRGFLLPGTLSREQAERAAGEVLADPISDSWTLASCGISAQEVAGLWPEHEASTRLLVRRKAGVQDAVARSVQEALGDLDIEVDAAGTYRAYLCPLRPDQPHLAERLANAGRLLGNEVIEEVIVDALPPGLPDPGAGHEEGRVEIPLAGLGDSELMAISEQGCFSLNVEEMKAIQAHYASLDRTPTLTELETLAQTWSEHCKHKTLTGHIDYKDGETGESRVYGNLLKESIAKVTTDLDRPWCVSVFVDNAGIVDFDGQDCLCIKVETHNHPSAIEPFGGAGTGIGGVIRDIMGTGLGARPLCNIDVFCVAEPDLAHSELPPGTLHPARVLDGIVAGVRDYGNPMGIPTVTGAVHFDPGFLGNPLVYAGTIGIIPRSRVEKKALPGDRILIAGGRTGRDGIHGATFSSVELHEESEMVSSGAVQIGDPITEKKLCDAQIEARDLGLYRCVTDCGAGGFSSAVGEMGETVGASVQLENAPLKYAGLTPTEIWISEAQERMVYAVPPEKVAAFHEVFAKYEVETADLGEFTGDERLRLYHGETLLADMEMDFLHNGVPRFLREARYEPRKLTAAQSTDCADHNAELLGALGDLAVASREWITRQFDHEVQGLTASKPFAGPRQKGPGDGAVMAPKPGTPLGFAVGTGLNPRFSYLDPGAMAEAALDEAMRNIVVKGGDPSQTAVLDNYCWGNPERAETLGDLVRATEKLCALAMVYGTPFISGKDSLYNEYRVGDKSIAIPGCLLVTAMAPVTNVYQVPDSAFTEAGNLVYILGLTRDELGGSVFLKRRGEYGDQVPRVHDAELHHRQYRCLHELIELGAVRAAHDLSEGGLAVAAAEMAFGGELGLLLDLANVPATEGMTDTRLLYSESLGRILIEVDPDHTETLEKLFTANDLPFAKVGEILDDPVLRCDGVEGTNLIHQSLEDCERAWREPLAQGPLALAPRSEDS